MGDVALFGKREIREGMKGKDIGRPMLLGSLGIDVNNIR